MNLYYCQASNEMKLLFIFHFPETHDGFVVITNEHEKKRYVWSLKTIYGFVVGKR